MSKLKRVDYGVNKPFLSSFNHEKYDEIFNEAAKQVSEKLESIPRFNKSIIGLSGGLDSAMTLLICYRAYELMGKDPKDYIIPVFMPTKNTNPESFKRARGLAKGLSLNLIEYDIEDLSNNILKLIDHRNHDVLYENNQVRLRALILMNLSNKLSGIVMGTSDLSEIVLGFYTFAGDQLSHFSTNTSFSKTFIQGLIESLKENRFKNIKPILNNILNAKISPELLPNQESEMVLGSYEINDYILYHSFFFGDKKEVIVDKLKKVFNLDEEKANIYFDNFWKRYHNNYFKIDGISKGVFITYSPFGDERHV